MLPTAAAADLRLVREITDLVNEVYVTAEAGLWVDGAARTTTAEIQQMIAANEIALARVDGRVVGAIRIQQLDDSVGEFGMLVAHPAHRGEGVGRELVGFAEELSGRRGLATMQLEVLLVAPDQGVPEGLVHPSRLQAGARRQHGRELPTTGPAAGDTVRLRRIPQAPEIGGRSGGEPGRLSQ
jgi:GNAT superfamily N-acetyltransferase